MIPLWVVECRQCRKTVKYSDWLERRSTECECNKGFKIYEEEST